MAYCVPVSLGDRSYQIEIEAGMLMSGRAAKAVAAVAPGRRAVLVTHPALRERYAEPLRKGLRTEGIAADIFTLPPGERGKTLRAVARCYDAFLVAGLDRKSLVIA